MSFSYVEQYVIQYCTDDVSSEEMLRGAATQKTEELLYSSKGLLLQEHFYDPFVNPKQVNSYYYEEKPLSLRSDSVSYRYCRYEYN